MSNPLLRLHDHVRKTIGNTVESLRRQAPGARMIGEFAVKHAAAEAQKRLRAEDTPTEANQPSDSSGEPQP